MEKTRSHYATNRQPTEEKSRTKRKPKNPNTRPLPPRRQQLQISINYFHHPTAGSSRQQNSAILAYRNLLAAIGTREGVSAQLVAVNPRSNKHAILLSGELEPELLSIQGVEPAGPVPSSASAVGGAGRLSPDA